MCDLAVDIRLRQGPLALDLRFQKSAPWTCLFGASGSGKSTVLRAIAGFVQPSAGSVRLGTQVLSDAASRIWLPAYRRPVRSAAQQAFLFPGTVRRNVGYAMEPKRSDAIDEVLERLRLTALAAADVRELSGGERQRVSLARAVGAAIYTREPIRLLLLDEPFAGMDAALRDELAGELRGWMEEQAIPVLSVTHDVGEAFLLRAQVVRLTDGKISAQGPAAEVLGEERERLLRRLSSR